MPQTEKSPNYKKEGLKYVMMLVVLAMALIYLAGHEDTNCKTKTEFLGDFAACGTDDHFSVFSRAGMELTFPGQQRGQMKLRGQGEVLVVSNKANGQCGTFFIVDDKIVFHAEDIESASKVHQVTVVDGPDGEKILTIDYTTTTNGVVALSQVVSNIGESHVIQYLSGYPNSSSLQHIECG